MMMHRFHKAGGLGGRLLEQPPLFDIVMRRANELEIRPAAVVVGCGDIGSAVAHALHRAGCAVVLVERYVHASRAGRLQTDRGIGECVPAGAEVATLNGEPIIAPFRGALRGLAARGARIAIGQRIVEIDPRGEPSLCFGLGERPKRIAAGVLEALMRRRALALSATRENQRESLHE